MSQAQLQRDRVVVPSPNPPDQPPPYGPGSSEPQFVMSPIAPATGHKSTGIMFLVSALAASTCILWKRDPHTKTWGVLATFDGASLPPLAPFQWITVCHLLASELWWQTDAQGTEGADVAILVEELSS